MDAKLPETAVAEILAGKIAALDAAQLPPAVRTKCEDLLIDVVGLCVTVRNEDYVKAAIAALPEEQREVIVLKEYQELTFLEIAEILGEPISTVKTRLYRGLGQLREKLERQGIRGAAPVPAPTT